MSTLFKNGDGDLRVGPASTLASGVAVGAVSMSVAPGTGNRFPVVVAPDVALVTLENATNFEIVKITARALGADTMTIVRAQEGTTDRAWLTGDIVSMRITAAQAELGANAQAVAATALAGHVAASDPHPGYTTAAELAAYAQPLDTELSALALMNPTRIADLAALSAFIGSLLNDPDEATARSTLGIINSATVRHSVLGGPVDANGYPAPGGATGGTSVVTTAITASAPFVVGFANGFGAQGESNLFGVATSDLTWSGLSTNGTMYLYVDYNAGGLTAGATTLAPVYQNGGTYSTTSGQATFNITEMVMKVGNGAAAVQTNRVFVGEVTVAGGVVTAITWYAYRGRYEASAVGLPAIGTATSRNHNIGVVPRIFNVMLVNGTAEQNYSIGDELPVWTENNSGTLTPSAAIASRLSVATIRGATSTVILNKTTGVSAAITAANWTYKFHADRGW